MSGFRDILRVFVARPGVSGVVDMARDMLFAPSVATVDRTCTADLRSVVRQRRGGTGVADTVEFCQKQADDTYAWRVGSPRLYVQFVVYNGDAVGLTWTNQPLAGQELFNTTVYRQRADLTGLTQIRLSAALTVAGAAAAIIFVQYSLNNGANWANVNGPAGDQVSLASTGWITGDWVSLIAAARTDVLLRIVGTGGDAVADPLITTISMECR